MMEGDNIEGRNNLRSNRDGAIEKDQLMTMFGRYRTEQETRKFDIRFWIGLQRELIELNKVEKKDDQDIINDQYKIDLKNQILNHFIEISEKAVEVFPTFGPCWQLYAEGLASAGERRTSSEVYRRAIGQSRSLDLFISYCRFVYGDGQLFPLLDALTTSVDRVGCDIRAHPLWRELLRLRIKIHNASVNRHRQSASNCQLTLHLDPFNKTESKQSKGKTQTCLFTDNQLDLLISSTLDLLSNDLISNDDNLDDNENEPHSDITSNSLLLSQLNERFSNEDSFDRIRLIYRNWLSTPTDGLATVWDGYADFERILLSSHSSKSGPSSAARALSNRMISSAQTIYSSSQKVYADLRSVKYYGGFQQTVGQIGSCESPPERLTTSNMAVWGRIARRWNRIISYELKNPIQLSFPLFIHRLTTIFETCLSSCSFHADFWVKYFQFLLSSGNQSKAVFVLRSANDRFLFRDEFLQLTLADHYESIGQQQQAQSILLSLISTSIPQTQRAQVESALSAIVEHTKTLTTEDLSESISDDQIEKCSVSILHLLNFIRKYYGFARAYAAFTILHSFATSEIYIFFSRLLWSCQRNAKAAKDVLDLGRDRFLNDENYLLDYSNTLIDIGFIDAAHSTLVESVNRLFQFEKVPPERLWKRLLSMESMYGSNPSEYHRLNLIYSEQCSKINHEDRRLFGASEILASTSKLDPSWTSTQRFMGPDQFTSPLVTFQPEHSGMIPIVSLPDSVSGVPKEDDSEGLIRDARRIGTETDSSSIKQQFEVDWKIRTHHPGYYKSLAKSDLQAPYNDYLVEEDDDEEEERNSELDAVHHVLVRCDPENALKRPAKRRRRGEEVDVFREEREASEQEEESRQRTLIILPDISKMIHFNPMSSNQITQQSNRQIPNPIQNFIYLLPSASSSILLNTPDRHPIDAVISTLQTAVIPNITINDYRPIPRRSTNHPSQSTVRFFSTAQHQEDQVQPPFLDSQPNSSEHRPIINFQNRTSDKFENDVFFNSSPNVYRDRLKRNLRAIY